MAEQQITGGGEPAPPVACTLTAEDLAARAGRWQAVITGEMTSRARIPGGLRLIFRAAPGTEAELRGLAAAERECCPWASWAVHTQDGQLVLTIRAATADGAATLHSMFAGPG